MSDSKRRQPKLPRLPVVLHNWHVLDDARDSGLDDATVIEGEVLSRTDATTPRDVSPTRQAARRIEQRSATIVVEFAQRHLRAAPGSAATTSATVLNNGQQPLTLAASLALAPSAQDDLSQNDVDDLRASNQPAQFTSWLHATPDLFHLQPGQRTEITLTAAPPSVSVDTLPLAAGDYPLVLTVAARDEPEHADGADNFAPRTVLAATLTVEPLVDVRLALSSPRLRVRWQPATQRPLTPDDAPTAVNVTNRGNQTLPLVVQVVAPSLRVQLATVATTSGTLHAARHQFDVVLRSGETRRIPLHVAAAGPRLLRARRQPLRLVAFATATSDASINGQSTSDAEPAELTVLAQARGLTLQRPLLGPWTLAALTTLSATLLVALAVAAAVAMIATPLARRAPPPAASTPSAPQVVALVLQMEAPVASGGGPAVLQAAPEISLTANRDGNAAIVAAPAVPQAAPTSTVPVIVVEPESLQPTVAQPPVQEAVAAEASEPANAPSDVAAAPPLIDAASGLPIVQPNQITGPGESASSQPLPVVSNPAPANNEPSPVTNNQQPASEGEMTYAQMFQAVGLRYDLDWRLLAAQAYIESSFDPNALGTNGDMGLMQILPDTWAVWSPVVNVDNPFDSYSNVLVAAAYLDGLRTDFSTLGYPEARWMLAAYNGGPEVAQAASLSGDWSSLDPVVQRYAEDILRIAKSIP